MARRRLYPTQGDSAFESLKEHGLPFHRETQKQRDSTVSFPLHLRQHCRVAPQTCPSGRVVLVEVRSSLRSVKVRRRHFAPLDARVHRLHSHLLFLCQPFTRKTLSLHTSSSADTRNLFQSSSPSQYLGGLLT